MKIRDIMQEKGKNIITVDSSITISGAIAKMVSDNIGAVVVQDEGQPSGILTERDVLRLWNRKEEVQNLQVRDVMTRNLIVTDMDDTLKEAMWVMIRKNIRHLIVVEKGKIAGFLSIRDLVKTQIKDTEAKIRYFEEIISSDIAKEL